LNSAQLFLLKKPHSHKQDVANDISMPTPFFLFYTLIQNSGKGILQQVSELTSKNCSPVVVMSVPVVDAASNDFLIQSNVSSPQPER
jgi:hypothetical protein